MQGFDFFPKLQDEVRVKTFSGGAGMRSRGRFCALAADSDGMVARARILVSIVSGLCIVVLFFSELAQFVSIVKTEHVLVDTSRSALANPRARARPAAPLTRPRRCTKAGRTP